MKRAIALRQLRYYLNKFGHQDWKVAINDRFIRQLGQTNFLTKTVSLSGHFVDESDYVAVKEVIMHEIAHVLCGHPYHNWLWKRFAAHLGATPCAKT